MGVLESPIRLSIPAKSSDCGLSAFCPARASTIMTWGRLPTFAPRMSRYFRGAKGDEPAPTSPRRSMHCEYPAGHERSGAVCQDRRTGRRLRRLADRVGPAGAPAGRDPARLPPDPLLRPADRAAGHRLHRADRQQDGHRPSAAQHACRAATCRSTWSQQDQYFDRDELYSVDGKDYIDNCERFVFFSRAVLEAIRLLDLQVDVLHANDWQTGLIPAYLKIEYHSRAALRADRQPVDDPQHRLPGPVLALGHAADRAWTGSTSTGTRWSSTAS